MKKKSNIPIVDKGGTFATQVAARIISMAMYKFDCGFTEISRLFDTYPKFWSDLINCDTELFEIGKTSRLEYTIDFIGELLHEERTGIGRACYKNGMAVMNKYPVALDGGEYAKINQYFFEENIRNSRLSTATPLKSITDNFICGDCDDPLVCLGDNSVSAWYCPEHQCVKYIRALLTQEGYKTDFIIKSRVGVLEEMEMLLDEEKANIYEKSGYSQSEFIKLPTHKIIEYCSNFAGLFFTECDYKDFATLEDLLGCLIPNQKTISFLELDSKTKNNIHSEVGIR